MRKTRERKKKKKKTSLRKYSLNNTCVHSSCEEDGLIPHSIALLLSQRKRCMCRKGNLSKDNGGVFNHIGKIANIENKMH